MNQQPGNRRRLTMRDLPGRSRRGSLTVEALLVLPVLLLVALGSVEFGLLLSCRHQLWGACREAGRLAALGHPRSRIHAAVCQYLGETRASHTELCLEDDQGHAVSEPGEIPAGTTVRVRLRIPATCAAPDLLRFAGFSLQGMMLEVHTVWRRE
jgi:hypothetical protein